MGGGGLGARGQPADGPRAAAHGLPRVQDLAHLREAHHLKAALTGGTGLVGGWLAERLVARGDDVRVLVRAPGRSDGLARLGCSIVCGDLEDERALALLAEGRQVVYHVAGLVAARSPDQFLRVNRDGAERVAAAAARASVARLLLVSSLSATGPSSGAPVDERTPERPLTAYGRSKLAGEQAVRSSGVPFTIVRPPAVYGPRDRAFLPVFRAAARGVVLLPGDGRQPVTLVHVSDLADALVAAANSPRTLGRTYHAGNPEPVTQRELAASIGRALGRRVRAVAVPALFVRPALGLLGGLTRAAGRSPLLDGDKANELLAPGWVCSSAALYADAGWQASIPLAAGLAETAGSYRALGWLPRGARDSPPVGPR